MQDTDGEMVKRWLGGDRGAFEALYAATAGRIKAYMLRSGFAPAEADDLTQETFLRAFRSAETFDPQRGRFGAWVATIARNVARRQWARRPSPDSFDPELAEQTLAAAERPGDSPEDRERIAALEACVSELPPELANVVRLRYVQARTTRGVASLTGLPEATVRLRLDQARQMLQACMGKKGMLE